MFECTSLQRTSAPRYKFFTGYQRTCAATCQSVKPGSQLVFAPTTTFCTPSPPVPVPPPQNQRPLLTVLLYSASARPPKTLPRTVGENQCSYPAVAPQPVVIWMLLPLM